MQKAAEQAGLDSLTALRGFAALTVLLFHAGVGSRGYLGVDLFFVLSGFVLTHAYGEKFRVFEAGTYRAFLQARLARIYPLHLLTLACLLPLYGQASQFSGVALIHNLLLTQAPWFGESWNFPAWSISAEWHAYLIFPLLAGLVAERGRRSLLAVAAASIATVGALYLAADMFSGNPQGALAFTPAVLIRVLGEFVAGMALYRLHRRGWATKLAGSGAMCPAILAVVVAAGMIPGTDPLIVVLLPALLYACVSNDGAMRRLLNGAAAQYLGRISYSVYMIQAVVQFALLRALPHASPFLFGTLFVAGTLLAAAPVSRFIEYPARNWLRDLALPRPTPRATARP